MDRQRRAPYVRLRRLACLSIAILAAAAGMASMGEGSFPLPWTRYRLPFADLAPLAGVLAASSVALLWAPPPWAFSVAVAGGLSSVLLVGSYRPPRPSDVLWSKQSRVWHSIEDWRETNTDFHPRYGYLGRPSCVARHFHRDFDVVYRHGADGSRVMPEPAGAPPHPEIWFIGCSFTYGDGVADDQTYPWLLARDAWPHCRVRNFSFSGWGTPSCRLLLEDKLKEQHPPRLVFYGYIGGHLIRNHLRQFPGSAARPPFPYFDLEGDRLVFRGIVEDPDRLVPDSPAVRATEIAVTEKLIVEMDRLCQDAGARFALLVLRDEDRTIPDLLEEKTPIPVLDVRGASKHLYAIDGHPTPLWHRAVARAIASDPRVAEWAEMPELFRPDAISPPAASWRLTMDHARGWSARLAERDRFEPPLRVHSIQMGDGGASPGSLVLRREGLRLSAGRTYILRVRWRADSPRPVVVRVAGSDPPWESAADIQRTVGPEGSLVEHRFVPERAIEPAEVSVLLGESDVATELLGAELWDSEHDLLSESAQTSRGGSRASGPTKQPRAPAREH